MAVTPQYLNPEPGEYPAYQSAYLDKVRDGDLFEQLRSQPDEVRSLLDGLSEEKQRYRYEADKWSTREILGHLIDTERVFAYRALRILRHDQTPLPGYDQDDFVENANFDAVPLSEILDEFDVVRASSVALLANCSEADFLRAGTASNHTVTVRAIANVLVGHVGHHVAIIQERYM